MKINLIANLNNNLIGLSFSSEKVITIGRDEGNTIAPLAVEGLSRNHAKIYLQDNKWLLEDLGSTNGSYRGGQKVEGAVELAVRDMLQFGKLNITIDNILEDGVGATATSDAPKAPEDVKPVEATLAASAIPPITVPDAVKSATPVAPVASEPASAAPTPAAPAPAASAPVAEPAPAPVAPAPAAPATPATSVLRRPALPTMKSGLKLPPKPGLATGLKLPPKPGLASGLKLPPKPGLAAGLKLPPKAPLKPVAPKPPVDGVAELTPVE